MDARPETLELLILEAEAFVKEKHLKSPEKNIIVLFTIILFIAGN